MSCRFSLHYEISKRDNHTTYQQSILTRMVFGLGPMNQLLAPLFVPNYPTQVCIMSIKSCPKLERPHQNKLDIPSGKGRKFS